MFINGKIKSDRSNVITEEAGCEGHKTTASFQGVQGGKPIVFVANLKSLRAAASNQGDHTMCTHNKILQ